MPLKIISKSVSNSRKVFQIISTKQYNTQSLLSQMNQQGLFYIHFYFFAHLICITFKLFFQHFQFCVLSYKYHMRHGDNFTLMRKSCEVFFYYVTFLKIFLNYFTWRKPLINKKKMKFALIVFSKWWLTFKSKVTRIQLSKLTCSVYYKILVLHVLLKLKKGCGISCLSILITERLDVNLLMS